VKSIATISIIVWVLVVVGCSGNQADALLGTWQTEILPSEWGPCFRGGTIGGASLSRDVAAFKYVHILF
jgi:hypothetical protein